MSVYTRQRLSKALLISNDGFSVVAPIKVMVPSSTGGRKKSYDGKARKGQPNEVQATSSERSHTCWFFLKRWISSTNTIVWRRNIFFSPLALSMASCMSPALDVAPDNVMNLLPVRRAITCASVVLPHPGGLHTRLNGCHCSIVVHGRHVPPEDHVWNPIGLNERREHFPGADQLLLPYELVQCGRSHALSERHICLWLCLLNASLLGSSIVCCLRRRRGQRAR